MLKPQKELTVADIPATPQERRAKEERDKQEFLDAFHKAEAEYARRQPIGQQIVFFHAQRGQYGLDLFVLMEQPAPDHNQDAKIFWGNPNKTKGTVVFASSPAALLAIAEKVADPHTYVMWQHKWTPTWVKALCEHHVIWPARAK